MHDDCLHMPPQFRCGACQRTRARVLRRMNENRLAAAAKDISLPDGDWLDELHRIEADDLHRLLEVQS